MTKWPTNNQIPYLYSDPADANPLLLSLNWRGFAAGINTHKQKEIKILIWTH